MNGFFFDRSHLVALMLTSALLCITPAQKCFAQTSEPATEPTSQPSADVDEIVSHEVDLAIDQCLSDGAYDRASGYSIPPLPTREELRKQADDMLAHPLPNSGETARLILNDASNRRFIEQGSQVFHDFKFLRSELTSFLEVRDHVHNFTGVRLEMYARLVSGELQKLRGSIGLK